MAGGSTPATTPNKRLYNGGSEWQDDIDGLADYYSTFFREYDAVIGRFNGVDPRAVETNELSAYVYGGNNPVMMNDPLGLSADPGWHHSEYGWLPNLEDLVDKVFKSGNDNYLQDAYNEWHDNRYTSPWNWDGGIGGNVGGPIGTGPSPEQLSVMYLLEGIRYSLEFRYLANNALCLFYGSARPDFSINGTYLCTGKNDLITDTRLDVATQCSMFVNSSTMFNVNESNQDQYCDYESMVVYQLVNNFINGTGPENYNFPTNGRISSQFFNSRIVQKALYDYSTGKLAPNQSRQYNFFASDFAIDAFRQETLFDIIGFTGSGTITIIPEVAGLRIKIFNITSLTSGDIYKNPYNYKNWIQSFIRNPDKRTPYGNISQTYNLFIPFK